MKVSVILGRKASTDIATVLPDASIGEAVAALSVRGIGALVVSPGDGQIAGILSERDVVRQLGREGLSTLERPVSDLCKLDFQIFEGSRTARVAMTPAGVPTAGEPVVCNGIYRRTGGFTPEQLGERNDFPFQLTYEAGADGFYEVSDFVATTTFGVARARRR